MIFWHGFVAKLIEFLAMKLLGKQIDLSFDRKRSACKSFLRLSEHLEHLEVLSAHLLNILERVERGEKDIVYYQSLEPISKEVDTASQEFLSIITELASIIAILDPKLALLFGSLRQGKKGWLYFASSGAFSPTYMRWTTRKHAKGYVDEVSWTRPSEDLQLEFLDLRYSEIKEPDRKSDSYRPEEIDWPADVLLSIVQSQITEIVLRPNDREQVSSLCRLLRGHIRDLQKAKGALSDFIRANFKIEDLLAHV